jgi:GDP/UDP-N,N'-diacetylbacillosamine 2-epimerase (hydrolysing)
MKRKICVVTGTRAEYGLLKNIMRRIDESDDLDLQLIVTGMHLVPEFGHSIDIIRDDGFKIDLEVPLVIEGNGKATMAQSIGFGIINLTLAYEVLNPDVVLILGDRFEIFAAATAAAYSGRVVAHIHGGDKLQAGYDEYSRHAITKISHIHFPATQKSAERIQKLGEEPSRIFIVGSPSIESIISIKYASKEKTFHKFQLDLQKNLILFVLHPLSTDPEGACNEMKIALESIVELSDQIIIIYPNVDPGSKDMIKILHSYESKYSEKIKSYTNLPYEDYLHLLKYCNVLVGNSSSGIIEAPSFHIPVINIGPRQKGRERADNIIDVPFKGDQISNALIRALNDEKFIHTVQNCANPYGEGKTSGIVCSILRDIKIDSSLLVKSITYD